MVDLFTYHGEEVAIMSEADKALAIREIVEALKALRDGKKPDTGICSEILFALGLSAGNVWKWSKFYGFSIWDEFSGNVQYPVSHYHYKDPEDAYIKTGWTRCRWFGAYGEARMRLLDHLIGFYSSVTIDELHSIAEGLNRG